MGRLPFFAALALIAAPLAAQDAETKLPGWIAGSWIMQDGAAWADEQWMAPRGGVMLGSGRSGFGPKLDSWEAMRIVVRPDGAISFYAQPRGAPATEFRMERMSEQAIDFVNEANDYPQRIRYWRQGQLLIAEISQVDGSRAMRWNFRPVAP
jgi:hypothetical protein